MARPFLVRVGDLLRDPGSRRDVTTEAPCDDLATSAAAVIPGMPVQLVATVVSMPGGVEATGTVRFDWYGACRRCLDDVTGGETVEFREICQREPVDEDVLPIDEDLLDLEPLVRELVLSGLPLAPLCRPDCPGPAPDRFPTQSEVDAADDGDVPADPRWAALSELRFDS